MRQILERDPETPARAIAAELGISTQRVYQILAALERRREREAS